MKALDRIANIGVRLQGLAITAVGLYGFKGLITFLIQDLCLTTVGAAILFSPLFWIIAVCGVSTVVTGGVPK